MQKCFLGFVEHSIKVTRINNGYNIRVFVNGILNQEVRCSNRLQIRNVITEILRTEDKCGNFSDMATASRKRQIKGVL